MSSTNKGGKGSLYGAGSKSTSKVASTANPVSPDTDISAVVNIPIIKSRDAARQLPSYTAALMRPADDYLAAEELDNIQLELERLLSNVALRYRVMKLEYDSIDRDEKIKDRKSKHGATGCNGASNEKLSVSLVTPHNNGSKRKREENASSRKSKQSNTKHYKNSMAKNSPILPHTDDSMEYNFHVSTGLGRDNKITLPKNDIPNKFWLSVEPYCMPLTNDDIRLLDDLLEQYNGPLVPPIPELGPHYTSTWANEDLKNFQLNPNIQESGNFVKSGQNVGTASQMLKKTDNGECVTGPLTQRLVSALIEDQISPNSGEILVENSNSSSENTHHSAQSQTTSGFRSIAMLSNCIGIENRLKNELIEQGILDLADFPDNNEDQILSEIKKLVAELSAIAEYNNDALKRLHKSATQEINRLEVKRKLDLIDQEILETYKRNIQNKVKRKPLTIEEQEEIYRLTNEQKTLSDQLDRLQENCFLME